MSHEAIKLPFAAFDEFGAPADDRVMIHGELCAIAARKQALEEAAALVESRWPELGPSGLAGAILKLSEQP